MRQQAADLFPNARRARQYGAPPPVAHEAVSLPLDPPTNENPATDESPVTDEYPPADENPLADMDIDTLIHDVRRELDHGPKIMVANPYPGTGTTTTAFALAATLGQIRQVPVLAWDLTGTDGYRPPLGYGYDVLAGTDLLAVGLRSADSLASLGSRLARDYEILVLDTGNDLDAPAWEAGDRIAGLVVVATTVDPEAVELGLLMLTALATGTDRPAIAVVSCVEPGTDPDLVEQVLARYRPHVRDIVVVPFDPALAYAETISYDDLGAPARHAYLSLAAAVVSVLRAG